jgi:glycosyltransferase involved in cell wall biosynthesis
MEPHKILFVCHFLPSVGGSEYTCWELVDAVVSGGSRVEVIAEPWEGDTEFDRAYHLQTGVRVHRLPERIPALTLLPAAETEGLKTYLSDYLDAKKAAGEAPDIAVVGEKYTCCIPILKDYGLPVVLHLMATRTNGVARGIYPPDRAEEYLRFASQADLMVCVARHLRKLVLSTFPNYPEGSVSVIHNEIDTAHFCPSLSDPDLKEKLKLPAEAKVIVHTSNFWPGKRMGDIVASAQEVLKERSDVYYILIGWLPHNSEVVSAIKSCDYASHFRVPGVVSQSQLPRYLRQGSVFILSSEYEGLPRAVMEAQACGLYLITSDCPAGRELTADGALGSIYPVADTYALAQTTLQVLDMERTQFDAIRKAGRDAIVKNYADLPPLTASS